MTEQIFSAKQNQNIRSIDWSIVNLEYSMEKQGSGRSVVEILSTGFGKSMIFTFFAQVKEEMSRDHNLSSKNGM